MLEWYVIERLSVICQTQVIFCLRLPTSEAFFRESIGRLIRGSYRPFNASKAAREGNDVTLNASWRLQIFIKLLTGLGKTVSEIVICIASALIIDAYLDRMYTILYICPTILLRMLRGFVYS